MNLMNVEEYRENSDQCPKCRSTMIEGESMNVDSDRVEQEMGCLECEFSWFDVYKRDYYVVREEPKQKSEEEQKAEKEREFREHLERREMRQAKLLAKGFKKVEVK